ncbi:MAG TPA: hypothetical protein VFI47_26580, partial [Acidimicrobiales bacterium]|nr:hypothetical protein [Acidimicrobiales bacterium]
MSVAADVDAPATSPATGRPFAGRRLAAMALPALAVMMLLTLGWRHRFSTDDAFINFRVVKQIEAGHGPVYNIGERVEVATSTLWLACLLMADLASPLRIEWTAVLLQLGFTGVGLGTAMAGAVRLADLGRPRPRTGGWIVPVGAVAYMGPVAAWDWATGGLENGLGLAWMGTTFLAVVTLVAHPGPGRRRILATAALVGLGVLVRPDFGVLSAGLAVPVAVVARRHGGRRRLAEAAAAAALLPLAAQVFRMGYYGQLFPNTLYAKEGTLAWWDQGWRYLRNFAGSYALAVPAVATAAWLAASGVAERGRGRRDRWIVIGAVEAAALGHALAVVRVGGDYMHARLLVPAWFTLLLPLAALPASDLRTKRTLAATVVLAAWAGVAALTLRPPAGSLMSSRAAALLTTLGIPAPPADATGIVDVRLSSIAASGDRTHPVTVDDGLPYHRSVDAWGDAGWFDPLGYPPGSGTELVVAPDIGRTVVPTVAAGAPGYAAPLDVWIYDRHGLADPLTARLALDRR